MLGQHFLDQVFQITLATWQAIGSEVRWLGTRLEQLSVSHDHNGGVVADNSQLI